MKAPERGYKLPKGYGSDYRATALAYLKREGLFTVENIDGNYYTLTQIENSIIGYHSKSIHNPYK